MGRRVARGGGGWPADGSVDLGLLQRINDDNIAGEMTEVAGQPEPHDTLTSGYMLWTNENMCDL